MICDCCRREVDFFRASFWHGDARICRECYAQWNNPDNDCVGDPLSIGNYVRLIHGLPPLAAALAILFLALTSTANASRHCLGHAEAARTWPTRVLARDRDGCWTYDHHPPRAEVPTWMPETIMPKREPALMDRWPDTNLLQIEQRESEPEPASQDAPPMALRHLALFVSLVLATLSVVEVATWRRQESGFHSRRKPARGPL